MVRAPDPSRPSTGCTRSALQVSADLDDNRVEPVYGGGGGEDLGEVVLAEMVNYLVDEPGLRLEVVRHESSADLGSLPDAVQRCPPRPRGSHRRRAASALALRADRQVLAGLGAGPADGPDPVWATSPLNAAVGLIPLTSPQLVPEETLVSGTPEVPGVLAGHAARKSRIWWFTSSGLLQVEKVAGFLDDQYFRSGAQGTARLCGDAHVDAAVFFAVQVERRPRNRRDSSWHQRGPGHDVRRAPRPVSRLTAGAMARRTQSRVLAAAGIGAELSWPLNFWPALAADGIAIAGFAAARTGAEVALSWPERTLAMDALREPARACQAGCQPVGVVTSTRWRAYSGLTATSTRALAALARGRVGRPGTLRTSLRSFTAAESSAGASLRLTG